MDSLFKAISDWLRMNVPVPEASTLRSSTLSVIVISTICVILLAWAMKRFDVRYVKVGFITIEAQPVSAVEKASKRKGEI